MTWSKIILVFIALSITLVRPASAQETPVKYEPNWASLDKRPTPPWFEDAKFGIFIHWGVYSVPAFAPTEGVGIYARYSEWYWKRSTDPKAEGYDQFRSFHDRVYGKDVQYQDFAPMFKAEAFDPDYWAEVFDKAGARYVVLTSKHHDGFCLWPSPQSWNWNAMDVGPHRDLAGDLTKAVKARGLKMGFYYSLYEWFNPLYKTDPDRYIAEHMLPQARDLILRYQPDIFWGDGEWDHPSARWKSEELLAWLYNETPAGVNVAVNDRWGKETRSKHGGYYTTEYGLVHKGAMDDETARHPWEECRGIGHSFGYNRMENISHYTSEQKLIHMLVELVSKGGNLLLDIGPTADGRIPVIMQQRLLAIGDWLNVNGPAIYATRRWDNPLEETNANVRYTRKGDDLYAIALNWPAQELVLTVPKPKPDTLMKISLLGREGDLRWEYVNGKLFIDVTDIHYNEVPCQHAFVFKIDDIGKNMR